MNIFKTFEKKISYEDILQLDGAFSTCHINYGKSPTFNGNDSKNIAKASRRDSLSSSEKVEDVIANMYSFDGTEKNFKKEDRIAIWKSYWLEYINAFDKLMEALPNSIVTVNVGRQAIENGFKYLLLKKGAKLEKTHDLGELSKLLFSEYNITESYMSEVESFCERYSKYIEGGNVEYFRFPEYKASTYFAGNKLDIEWISYNFALIILKLLHFAELEGEM